jgi:hypothetical protein
MSADGISGVKKPDVPVTAHDQGKDVGAAARAKGQDGALARQPVTALNRHDHADAILAGTPGRPREASGASAAPDHQQAGKAARTPPEHGGRGKDADITAGTKGQDHTHTRQPATALNRHDHADAILARQPVRPSATGDLNAAGGHHSRPAGQETPGRAAGPGPEQAGAGDGRQAGTGSRTETRQHGHGRADSQDGSRPGAGLSAGIEQPPAGKRPAPEAATGPSGRAVGNDGKAAAGATAHVDGKNMTGQDGAPGQRPDAVAAGHQPDRDSLQHDNQQAPARRDGREPPARQESRESRKVYVDGHEIEATGNPAEGIWIQGLPGEVPDKIGDALASPENTKRSRGDKFFHAVVEGADNLFDSVEKNTSLSYDALKHPPPAHAEAAVPVPGGRPTVEAQQQYAPDAAGIATGVLTLGILGWAAGYRIHDWIDQRARRAHDASN